MPNGEEQQEQRPGIGRQIAGKAAKSLLKKAIGPELAAGCGIGAIILLVVLILVGAVALVFINPEGTPTTTTPGGINTINTIKITELAKKQLGKPYVWGMPPGGYASWSKYPPATTNEPSSFDCSGLTGWCYYWGTDGKIALPHSATMQYDELGIKVVEKHDPRKITTEELTKLQAGDLVFFKGARGTTIRIGHVGIFLGEETTSKGIKVKDAFIHAGNPVNIASLNTRRDFMGAARAIY